LKLYRAATIIKGADVTTLLKIKGVSKRFEGIAASNDISLEVNEGDLHAIIGPNGAGKTTLIGEIDGEITPDAGHIVFAGYDITRLPTYRRSLLGLARSFQITSLFLNFTTIENVALAVQAHSGHSFRFWCNAALDSQLKEPALAALKQVGLDHRAHSRASELSHGEHRLLEIAMALATRPRMLLLDEPMAGLGLDESRRMLEMLRGLKREFTILLVEHDIEAVFALADRITVLFEGRVLASGLPAAIRVDVEVKRAYLGEQEVVEIAPARLAEKPGVKRKRR
jgi:branched-chain amino acid transport system ATP-binding protein